MTITYVAAGTVVDTASGTPSLPFPAGISANDVLVAVGVEKNSANTIAAPSTGGLTWTERVANGVFHKIWTAVYDGVSTAPTVASGGNAVFYEMFAFRGVDTTTPVSASSSGTAPTQANMHYGALTVPTDGSAVFTFCKDNGAITSVAQAASFTEVLDRNCTSAAMGVHGQYWIQTTATNITATDLTVTGGSSVTQTGLVIVLSPTLVKLTGQAQTFSAGTLGVAVSVALTGQAATFAAGALVAAGVPAGKQLVTVAGLPWLAGEVSWFEGATPPVQNGYVAVVDQVTTPSGYTLTLSPTGVPSYDAHGDASRQSAVLDVDFPGGSYGPVTEYINNTPPTLAVAETYTYTYVQGVAITALDFSSYATDAEGDAIAITLVSGGFPTGTGFDGTRLTGTPTLLGQTITALMRWTDIVGDSVSATFTFQVSSLPGVGTPSIPYFSGMGPSSFNFTGRPR